MLSPRLMSGQFVRSEPQLLNHVIKLKNERVSTNFCPPAIVKAVKFSMKLADDALTNHVLYSDYLAAKNIGDKVGQEGGEKNISLLSVQNLWATITIPTLIFLVLFVIGCLFFTRNDSICCQVGSRSISH